VIRNELVVPLEILKSFFELTFVLVGLTKFGDELQILLEGVLRVVRVQSLTVIGVQANTQ
jgi:hypothetical protein